MLQLSRIASAFGAMGLAPASVEPTKSRHFILAAIYVNFQKVDEEKTTWVRASYCDTEEKTA